MILKQSAFLQTVGAKGRRELICYNSLCGAGNLHFVFDDAYIDMLESFRNPRPVREDDDRQIVDGLMEAGILVDAEITRGQERQAYDDSIANWGEQIRGGRKIAYLNLSVSETCNFGCPHCSRVCADELNVHSSEDNKLMSWPLAKKAIDYFWQNFCSPLGIDADIHFGSDEPLLNWAVVRKSVKYIRGINPGAIISINTNLSVLTEEMALFFKEEDIDIISSLDGLAVGNNAVRIFKNGKGTFERIVEKAKLLEGVGYPVGGFITTILDGNWEAVNREYIDWAVEMKLRSIAIDVDLVKTMRFSPRECTEKLLYLYDYMQEKGLICGGSWLNPFKTLLNGSADRMPAYCKCIKGCGISVSPDGSVHLCSGSSSPLGKIDDGLEMFEEGSVYHSLVMRKISTADTACDGCPIESVCKNQCFMTSEYSEETGNGRKEEMCQIYREATEGLLRRQLFKELASLKQ